MNPQEDPRTLIVAMKGISISIVAMLRNYPLPVSQAALCNVLDSSDKTVSRALHHLQEFGFVTHSTEGWRMTAQISLLGFSLPEWFEKAAELEEPVEDIVDTCPEDTSPQGKGRKNSDPGASSSTSSSYLNNNLKLDKNLLPVLDLDAEPESKPKSPEQIQECFKVALAAGIWEIRARKMAKMPHVTPQFITDHVEAVIAEGKDIKLAAFRIEKNWEAHKPPEQKSRGWDDRQKYVGGKYADWVNH